MPLTMKSRVTSQIKSTTQSNSSQYGKRRLQILGFKRPETPKARFNEDVGEETKSIRQEVANNNLKLKSGLNARTLRNADGVSTQSGLLSLHEKTPSIGSKQFMKLNGGDKTSLKSSASTVNRNALRKTQQLLAQLKQAKQENDL